MAQSEKPVQKFNEQNWNPNGSRVRGECRAERETVRSKSSKFVSSVAATLEVAKKKPNISNNDSTNKLQQLYISFCYAEQIKLRFCYCCHENESARWRERRVESMSEWCRKKLEHILTFIFGNKKDFTIQRRAVCVCCSMHLHFNYVRTQCSDTEAKCLMCFHCHCHCRIHEYASVDWICAEQMNAVVKCQRHRWCW